MQSPRILKTVPTQLSESSVVAGNESSSASSACPSGTRHKSTSAQFEQLPKFKQRVGQLMSAIVCGASRTNTVNKTQLPRTANAADLFKTMKRLASNAIDCRSTGTVTELRGRELLAMLHRDMRRHAVPSTGEVAMRTALGDIAQACSPQLTSMVGERAVQDLIEFLAPMYGWTLDQLSSRRPDELVDEIDSVLSLETTHLQQAKLHVESQLHQLTTKPASVCTESAREIDDERDAAASIDAAVNWILAAATSPGKNKAVLSALLNDYVENDVNLADPSVVKTIHSALLPQLPRQHRGVAIAGGNLPSSICGKVLLDQHLQTLSALHSNDPNLGRHLFAGVIRYHGFVDGNGRVGRAMYAIALLRRRQFTPLSPREEFDLHGLT